MEIEDLSLVETSQNRPKLPRVSSGEPTDEALTEKAAIGEASKCAELGKTSMTRPPKMPHILGSVED